MDDDAITEPVEAWPDDLVAWSEDGHVRNVSDLGPMTDEADPEAPRPDCPRCGAPDPLAILWSMVDFETYSALRGVTMGGCCVTTDAPQWECRQCEHRFTSPRPSVAGILRHVVQPALGAVRADDVLEELQLRWEGVRPARSGSDLLLVVTIAGRVFRTALVSDDRPLRTLAESRRALIADLEDFLEIGVDDEPAG